MLQVAVEQVLEVIKTTWMGGMATWRKHQYLLLNAGVWRTGRILVSNKEKQPPMIRNSLASVLCVTLLAAMSPGRIAQGSPLQLPAKAAAPQAETAKAESFGSEFDLENALTRLKLAGISDAPDDVEQYVRAMTGEQNRLLENVQQRIEELGDDHYVVREAASAALAGLMPMATEVLRQATKHGDMEVRVRANTILRSGQAHAVKNLAAVFMVIRLKNYRGFDDVLLPLLIKTVQGTQDVALRTESEQLLLQRTTTAQLPAVFEALSGASPEADKTALKLVEQHAGEDATKYLLPLSKSKSVSVKLAAIQVLADRGERDVLPGLLELLSAEDVTARYDACMTLRCLTGQQFGFQPGQSALARAAAVERWNRWIDENGQTANLHSPLLDRSEMIAGTLFEADFEKPAFANQYSNSAAGTVFNFGGGRGRYNYDNFPDHQPPSGKFAAYANGGGNDIYVSIGKLEPNAKYTFSLMVGDGIPSSYCGYEIEFLVLNEKTNQWETIAQDSESGKANQLDAKFEKQSVTLTSGDSLTNDANEELIGGELRIQFSGFGNHVAGNGIQAVFDDIKVTVQAAK